MYKQTTLKNNLTVVTHQMKGAFSVSIGVWLKVGSRYEVQRTSGISHFLEHVVFKGSKKYDNEAIKRQIEGSGGMLNGFTSEELTCYLAKVPYKRTQPVFNILLDMALHPLLKSEDIQKERTVIIEEIKMYNDLPPHIVQELLEKTMWPDHPLGWNIAGTAETVGAISRDDLADYQKKYYQPQNMVVVFAGNAGHKDCLDFVRKALDGPAAKAQDYSFQKFISRQEKPELISLTKDIEQTKLAIGFPAYDKNNPKRYALGLIAIILGGNMSSRLFNEIREKKGLAYEISSQYKQLNDTGAFYILAGLDNKKIEMALELTLKELSKLKNNLVPEPELSRAKEYSLSHLAMSLEDTMEHMVFLGVEAATSGRLIDYQEIKKEISRVKPKDIKEVAREIFHKGKINISLVGPVKDFNKDKCFSDIDAILD